MRRFSVTEFGAAADGATDDAPALQRAIDAASESGGGQVVIPAGATVLAGSFELRSRIDFHIGSGAVLRSATGIEAFPRRVFGSGEEAEKRLWIGARDARDISLSGEGTIDGQCRAFALGEKEHIYAPTVRWRPAMTCFENVRGLRVSGLTFRDAANWTLHFSGCTDVDVHDVRILNDLRFPNADGIDPDHCQRVRISRCHIVSADDCIVLKNTAAYSRYGPCRDIVVSDCRLESVSAAFKIGSESHGDFRNVLVRDCVIERSNRGLAIQLRDSGDVEDIEFRNIRIGTRRYSPDWWGAGEAISITALPRSKGGEVGSIRNVRFEGITCEGENGLVIYSDPDGRIDGLDFRNVHFGIERTTAWEDGVFDVRPFQGGYLPRDSVPCGEQTPWGCPCLRPPTAISIDGASGVSGTDVTYSLPSNGRSKWQAMNPGAAAAGFAARALSSPPSAD